MDEYISKHDVLVALMDNDLDHIQAPNGKEAVQIFSELPPADVMKVVRCRDCAGCEYDTALDQYWCTRGRLIIGRHVMPDDFCSYGKREE